MPNRPVNALSIGVIAVIDQLTSAMKPEHAIPILHEIRIAIEARIEELDLELENEESE